MSGAEALVDALARAGVDVVFGLPGVHNLPIWRALRSSDIRLVGVRHEQAAAYAADGYARASGRAGVALVTTGPGAANAVTGTGEAWASGSPIVVIATDVPTGLRRPGVTRGALHETPGQQRFFEPVTKRRMIAAPGDDLGALASAAVRDAAAAPAGPVYLEVPTDLLGAPAARAGDAAESARAPAGPAPAAAPPAADIERAAALLAGAARPLIWAGGGAARAGAGEAVGRLAERVGAPVLTTYGARGLLPRDHPHDLGVPPHVPEVGRVWDEADVVVVVGSDLDGMSTQNWAQPAPPALVTINVDPVDAAKSYEPTVGLAGDARTLAVALADAVPAGRAGAARPWVDAARVRAAVWARLEAEAPDAIAFLRAFARAVPDEAVVLADMCIPGYWLGALHRPPATGRFGYPVGWGTLGWAFPASLGAALARGGPAVSVSGDGGFLFACGELATAAQEGLPLTAVIVDDGGYGMLRFDQDRAGDERFGVDLVAPDFVALAAAFGLHAERVAGLAADFESALARQVADPRPTVLVAGAALPPPHNTSPRWYRHGRR